MNKTLTFDEANAIIQEDFLDPKGSFYSVDKQKKIAALRELINSLDVKSEGNITLLYSGMMNKDIHSTGIIDAVIMGENNRILNKTEAFKFLDFDDRNGEPKNKYLKEVFW